MRRFLLSFCLLSALASTVVAHADTFYTYSYTGSGVSGSGDVSLAPTAAGGVFQVTYIGGQVNGIAITGLLPVDSYKNNDNLFTADPYLDDNGVSFLLADGANVNIFYVNGDWFFQGDGDFVLGGGGVQAASSSFRSFSRMQSQVSANTPLRLTSFTFAPEEVAATPEPSSFALLGTGVLGAAGMLRRRMGRA